MAEWYLEFVEWGAVKLTCLGGRKFTETFEKGVILQKYYLMKTTNAAPHPFPCDVTKEQSPTIPALISQIKFT